MKKLTFLKKGVKGLGSLIGMMMVGFDLMYALVHFEHLAQGLHRKTQPEELMKGLSIEVRRMGHWHEVE